MAEPLLDEKRIKGLLKEAVIEALRENQEVLYDVVAEVMEDIALAKAIEEGKTTERVSRDEVMQVLKDVK